MLTEFDYKVLQETFTGWYYALMKIGSSVYKSEMYTTKKELDYNMAYMINDMLTK